MSRLSTLIAEARSGLSIQERISHEKWAAIASQCGAAEIVEIERRIASLRAELETIEAWDGDTMEDINIAINHFSKLLRMAAGAL
ncbi:MULTISPECIES: hypothetical protein [Pseudomonas]|jgi:predicted methyltransferase|uniref:Methyltransferase n=2 Tax=Pseudomonas TaxID=286 RepID=A0ACC5M7Z0_9PSED|nr:MULTISPECIES: hypothetical protein [Pseudomonas]ATE76568.1 hypothetical protein CNN82_09085 [Pseudomonas frederiksbergensis]MBB2884841.1 putative methyltransferase [Pseudomonas umsongensis]NMN74491.1 hypothetical protein [Pseudomonas sp. KD5]CAH0249050.1 hypothetical protein SRABI123_03089 [Pseudomonas sp. Bi123]